MKEAFCPMKKRCLDRCEECICHNRFRQLARTIAKQNRKIRAMERELAAYRQLGSVEELTEAVKALYP